jgi:hypothetical protein
MIKQTYKSKNRIKTTEKQASPSLKPESEPLVETVLSASKVSLAAAASAPNCESGPRPPLVIKLGIDVHLDRYVMVRQIDGGAPQPPQRFSPGQFLEWAQKQTALAKQVYSCYEAGPFGYRLHRKLKELGITNYVVRGGVIRGGVRTKFLRCFGLFHHHPRVRTISRCGETLFRL